MLDGIKNWFNWPKGGVKNINEFGTYFWANKWALLAVIAGVIFVLWVLRKIWTTVFGGNRNN